MIRKILSGAGAIGASLYAATAWAQEAAEAVADTATAAAAAAPAPVAEAAAAVANPGNNAWMMTSTVLVLLMILPGLALFYGGLTRSKNMLSTMTQIGATAALAMVVWVLWGYSTAFGPEGNAFFSWGNLFLSATSTDSTAATFSDEVISEYVFLSFQMTFAAITAALILRDQSALRTLGGGVVIDPFPPQTRRRRDQHLATLEALERPTPAEALAALLDLALPTGIDARRFTTLWNLPQADWRALLAALPHRAISDGARELLFSPAQLERYAAAVSGHLAAYHQRKPDHPGLTQEQLQRAVRDKPAGALFALLLRELVRGGTLKRSGPHLSLAGHSAALQGAERQLWERLKPWLDEGGVHPPRLSDLLLRDRSLRRDQILRVFERLQRMGNLHAVGAEYFIQTTHLLALAVHAWELAQADPHKRLNVKALRERTGISRHLSVPLVEYFDQIGLTRRYEIGRHFRRDPRLVFDG